MDREGREQLAELARARARVAQTFGAIDAAFADYSGTRIDGVDDAVAAARAALGRVRELVDAHLDRAGQEIRARS